MKHEAKGLLAIVLLALIALGLIDVFERMVRAIV